MSTHEREAMEAELIEDVKYVRSHDGTTYDAKEPWHDVYPDQQFIDRAKNLSAHIEARHARSRQPITVEGLVEMGAVRTSDEVTFYGQGFILTAALRQEKPAWWELDGETIPEHFAPQFLGDVDNLIKRLSR